MHLVKIDRMHEIKQLVDLPEGKLTSKMHLFTSTKHSNATTLITFDETMQMYLIRHMKHISDIFGQSGRCFIVGVLILVNRHIGFGQPTIWSIRGQPTL